MAQSITSIRFPVRCPSCGQKKGVPVGTSDPSVVVLTVTISCSNCSLMWTQQAEQPPAVLPAANE